jgi:GT2 family glycosyltransferase
MPRLSIVIFCFQDTQLLEETLVGVLQHRPEDSEVLVVHDGRYEDPYELADEVQFIEAEGVQSMAEAANLAMDHATGLILHFLASGVWVEAQWADAVLKSFDDANLVAATPLLLEGRHETVACLGVKLSGLQNRQLVGFGHEGSDVSLCELSSDGPNLVASFYRRSQLVSLGGFREEYGDEYADLDAALRLKSVGGEILTATDCVLHVNRWDKPRKFSAWRRGQLHQRFLADRRSKIGSFRYHLATLANSVLEMLTSPRSPGRLFTAWGRLLAWRTGGVSDALEVNAPTSENVLSIEQARREQASQASSGEERSVGRRAA